MATRLPSQTSRGLDIALTSFPSLRRHWSLVLLLTEHVCVYRLAVSTQRWPETSKTKPKFPPRMKIKKINLMEDLDWKVSFTVRNV